MIMNRVPYMKTRGHNALQFYTSNMSENYGHRIAALRLNQEYAKNETGLPTIPAPHAVYTS